jgi:hypothetical protein
VSFRAVCTLILLIGLAACDEGKAVYLTVENTTSEAVLARAFGEQDFNPAKAYLQTFLVPANSKLALAKLTFAGSPRIDQVEILRPDCSAIADLTNFSRDGYLIVVSDGPRADLRDESPAGGELAAPTEQCQRPSK